MRTIILLFICVAAFLASPTLEAAAAMQEVRWQAGPEEDPKEARREAMRMAFAQALVAASMDMLPRSAGMSAPLSPERQMALAEYFAQDPDPFVISYSVLNEGETDTGEQRMVVDVTVNERVLKNRLQALGVYYEGGPTAYERLLTESSEEILETLDRLERIAGLQPSGNATVRLLADKAGEAWFVRMEERAGLDNATTVFSASSHGELDASWENVWGRYYDQPRFESGLYETGLVREALLTVRGWHTPDGVQGFDRLLRGWDASMKGAVDTVRLLRIAAQPPQIEAVWALTLRDRAALERRLDEFLPPRKLSYSLARSGSSDGLIEPAPGGAGQ